MRTTIFLAIAKSLSFHATIIPTTFLTLPLLPSEEWLARTLDFRLLNVTRRFQIPQLLWIAVKNASQPLPTHLVHDLFKKNDKWTVVIVGNAEKDQFIDDVWNGTKVQWMYHAINPSLGAAKADIWRYAALYCYGGFYIDYDANMRTKLDDIIQPSDTLIVGEDGTSYMDYFRPEFKLSNNATYANYHSTHQKSNESIFSLLSTMGHITGYDVSTGWPLFWHDKFIVNWALFTIPRNIVMIRLMNHIATILLSEYVREPVIAMTTGYAKYLFLLFSTCYPLTSTIRELLLENTPAFRPRIVNTDFRQYGGKCKAMHSAHDYTHYRSVMKKSGHMPELLSTYRMYNLSNAIRWVEGWTVIASAGGKSLFLIKGGVKYVIPDYDTFLAMGRNPTKILCISDDVFRAIPSRSLSTLRSIDYLTNTTIKM